MSAAPQRELERLSWAQPELDYLSSSLPHDEDVLSVASIQGMGTGIAFGVIALTPRRLVAILGQRDKGGARGRPVGAPAVTSTELRKIQDLSYGSKRVRGVRGYFARFTVEGMGEFIMDIGQDDDWADTFLDEVRRQVGRAKMQ